MIVAFVMFRILHVNHIYISCMPLFLFHLCQPTFSHCRCIPCKTITPTKLHHSVHSTHILRLLISHDLSWSEHIRIICNTAKKLFGLIYRRFYIPACRPKYSTPDVYISHCLLEYGSPLWNPHKAGDVTLIEDVQKFARRMYTQKKWNTS